MNLAPVADVNVDPLNPVIGLRSFGADPDVVARQVAAAVRGVQRSGIAACVKHFPGHGATRSDSHHEVARLDRSPTELETVELVPFRSAIDAGVRAVMTGHLVATALDERNLATVSRAITTTTLRDRLGFHGTVVTDALEMKAVSATIGMVEGFVQALIAGADAIETGALDYPELVEEIPRAVENAIRDGRLTEARLHEAASNAARLAEPGRATQFNRALVDGAAGRCLEVIATVPVLHDPIVIECHPPGGMAGGELPWSLAAAMGVSAQVVTHDSPPPDVLVEREPARTLIVVIRDPMRYAWQLPWIERARSTRGAVLVDVGWPYEALLRGRLHPHPRHRSRLDGRGGRRAHPLWRAAMTTSAFDETLTEPGALMAAEIDEQPAVLAALLREGAGQVAEAAERIARAAPRFVVFAARGTSDHAALYAKYLTEIRLGLPAGLASLSSMTVYQARPDLSDVLFVAVSQSGGSPDLIESLTAARECGALTLAVTNDPSSPLAAAADIEVDVRAGREAAVAATKTYTAELLALFLLFGGPGAAGRADGLADAAARTLASDAVARVAGRYRTASRLVTTARGYSYPTAREAALKLMETSYLSAQAFSARRPAARSDGHGRRRRPRHRGDRTRPRRRGDGPGGRAVGRERCRRAVRGSGPTDCRSPLTASTRNSCRSWRSCRCSNWPGGSRSTGAMIRIARGA